MPTHLPPVAHRRLREPAPGSRRSKAVSPKHLTWDIPGGRIRAGITLAAAASMLLLCSAAGCSTTTGAAASMDGGQSADFTGCQFATGVSADAGASCASCAHSSCSQPLQAYQEACSDGLRCECAGASDCGASFSSSGCQTAMSTLSSCVAGNCVGACSAVDAGPNTGCISDGTGGCLCSSDLSGDDKTCDTSSLGGSVCRQAECYCDCSPWSCGPGNFGAVCSCNKSTTEFASAPSCTGKVCCLDLEADACDCYAAGDPSVCSSSGVGIAVPSCNLVDIKGMLEKTTMYGTLIDSCTFKGGTDPQAASCTSTSSPDAGGGGGGGCVPEQCVDGTGCYCNGPLNSPSSVCVCPSP
jgi:hypothetical protein